MRARRLRASAPTLRLQPNRGSSRHGRFASKPCKSETASCPPINASPSWPANRNGEVILGVASTKEWEQEWEADVVRCRTMALGRAAPKEMVAALLRSQTNLRPRIKSRERKRTSRWMPQRLAPRGIQSTRSLGTLPSFGSRETARVVRRRTAWRQLVRRDRRTMFNCADHRRFGHALGISH
jgi:hypothetical protein